MQSTKKFQRKQKAKIAHSRLPGLVKRNILGVGVTDDTKENILEFVIGSLENLAKPYYIVTPNPEIIVAASKNLAFAQALNHAKIALNDGVGLSIAAKCMGKPLVERFTGVEFVEKVCEKSNDWPITVGFLGSRPGVAEKAAECLKSQYPNLKVAFVAQEWGTEGFDLARKYQVSSSKYQEERNPKTRNTKYVIHTTNVDILFVAFGAPKQELWMAQRIGKIPVKVMVGVGGALDQIANPSLRPPRLVQHFGLGWVYRLIRQPWRLKRQFALITFIGMALKERFK